MRFTSLFVGVGDRRQETGDRRQETGDRRQETGDRRQETGDRRQETGDRRQETGVRIAPRLFYHSQPKILAFCSSRHRKAGTFLNPKKANTFIYQYARELISKP
ncbi:hypothetical protein [Okeania sp. SIO1H4]|uniref:hypothetical protein n=1 Tax=Okeania sp. SIO1H4 TaxID=2607776 RepID=UPI0013C81844|nr:hypothetical protein [Okeania sp. SIO1H4]NES78059.1 hypothetical protein [Okeania sp. SIO1H4]